MDTLKKKQSFEISDCEEFNQQELDAIQEHSKLGLVLNACEGSTNSLGLLTSVVWASKRFVACSTCSGDGMVECGCCEALSTCGDCEGEGRRITLTDVCETKCDGCTLIHILDDQKADWVREMLEIDRDKMAC